MANATGRAWLLGKPTPVEPSPAVEEWSTRVGAAVPGDIPKPPNTLRGVSQPWRNSQHAIDATLNDPGPLHCSVHRQPGSSEGVFSGHYEAMGQTAARTGTINGTIVPRTTSTATLEKGDWEQRAARAPLRGSLVPNSKPLTEGQLDLTGTGSCNYGALWNPHSHTSATASPLADAKRQAKATKSTNSSATIQRREWEERLKDYKTGVLAPEL